MSKTPAKTSSPAATKTAAKARTCTRNFTRTRGQVSGGQERGTCCADLQDRLPDTSRRFQGWRQEDRAPARCSACGTAHAHLC